MRLTDTPRPCRSMPARDGEGRAEQGRDPHGARVRAVPRASTPGTDERFGRPAGRFADGAPSWTGPDRASITPALYRPRVLRGAGAQVAQLVEHVTENHGVGGSIPPLGTRIIPIKGLVCSKAYTNRQHEQSGIELITN